MLDIYRGCTIFGYGAHCFFVCHMKFVCINVAKWDLVHDVETILPSLTAKAPNV